MTATLEEKYPQGQSRWLALEKACGDRVKLISLVACGGEILGDIFLFSKLSRQLSSCSRGGVVARQTSVELFLQSQACHRK